MGPALGSSTPPPPAARPLPRPDLTKADAVTFNELDIPRQAIDVYGSASLTFELPLNRLPPGRRPYALSLNGKGATVPQGESMVVAVYAGRRLVWSETYRGQLDLNEVRINLPPDLIRHRMAVTLRLMRDRHPPQLHLFGCACPSSWPAAAGCCCRMASSPPANSAACPSRIPRRR